MNYWNKIILAPMVRGSTLPMRTLALRYGADLVYTDEMIDVSLSTADRRVNESLETVDYISKVNGDLIFRTSPKEKDKLVFQMGTASDENAVKVAKYVQNDVSAIDVNMGCPKPFSCDFGMGAALLEKPERAKDILRALVKNIPLPITCKIRILPNINESIKMVQDFESIGVSAIAVHGRTKEQQSEGQVDRDAIRRIVESVKIPIIANGASDEINTYEDVIKFREDCGAASVMLARAAQRNISIFRKEGLVDRDEIIREYLKVCVDYDNTVLNTKYSIELLYTMNRKNIFRTELREEYEKAQNLEELCAVWNLRDYCQQTQRENEAKGHKSVLKIPRDPANKLVNLFKLRRIMYEKMDVTLAMIKLNSNTINSKFLPKNLLENYAEQQNCQRPVYKTEKEGRFFYSIVEFMGKQYSSLLWERTPKRAEENSALVCMQALKLAEESYFKENVYFVDFPPREP